MQWVKEKYKTLEKETMLLCQASSERDAEKICLRVRECVCVWETECVCVNVSVCVREWERKKLCAEVCQGILLPGYIFKEEKTAGTKKRERKKGGSTS